MATGSLGRSLASRRIVITGAARGLGRALAVAVADAGGSVVLLGRDTAALDSVAATIFSRTQQRAEVVRCDLAQPASIRAACEVILGANPAVDVLINNGAPWLEGRLADLSEADIVATVAAGVTGTILITRGLLPGLARSRAADIVTIVSTAGLPGGEFDSASTAFHAAKAWPDRFLRQIACRGEVSGHPRRRDLSGRLRARRSGLRQRPGTNRRRQADQH